MKLTELIDELTKILKECGDKETFFYIADEESGELEDIMLDCQPVCFEIKDEEIHIGIDIAYE